MTNEEREKRIERLKQIQKLPCGSPQDNGERCPDCQNFDFLLSEIERIKNPLDNTERDLNSARQDRKNAIGLLKKEKDQNHSLRSENEALRAEVEDWREGAKKLCLKNVHQMKSIVLVCLI